MAKEIERKFLVKDRTYRDMAVRTIEIRQGYLSTNPNATVRVRTTNQDAFITVKGPNDGTTRDEWEYTIPKADAIDMLQRVCQSAIIDKVRYIVPYAGMTWEVDEFLSPIAGLIVAEVELSNPDQQIEMPPFVGREVTGNPEYYNSSISLNHKPPKANDL